MWGVGERRCCINAITTLPRWEASGRLIAEHTAGVHWYYDLAKLEPELFQSQEDEAARQKIAYAPHRIERHNQKDELEHDKQVLALYCAGQGSTLEVPADLGKA
ncbi:MAG: hypothetical protein VB140_09410 [Burkholderia sp.]|nr:MAG: hypothetical protein E5299_01907 [Burkholderia gladioli]